MFLRGQIFSNLFVKVDRVDTDRSCTLIKNFFLFFGVCFDDVMCMLLFFFSPCRDWMYNISHSLNIHDLPTMFEEKDKERKEKQKLPPTVRSVWVWQLVICELTEKFHSIVFPAISFLLQRREKLGLWVRRKNRNVYFEA